MLIKLPQYPGMKT